MGLRVTRGPVPLLPCCDAVDLSSPIEDVLISLSGQTRLCETYVDDRRVLE